MLNLDQMDFEIATLNQRYYDDEISFDELLELQAVVYDRYGFDPDED